MTSFQGVINPASGVNFPLSITLTLQQGGSGVPGGGVLHTFHTSADAAVLPIAVPVAVTSAPPPYSWWGREAASSTAASP